MRAFFRQDGILLVAMAAAFAAAISLGGYVEKHRVSLPESYADEDLDLQGRRLKGFALGFEGLLADWYWMRSLQYIGDKIVKSDQEVVSLDDLRPLNPRLLYPLLENATELDPKFISAYSYGAILLPAIDPKQAIAFTEKGIENNPNEWRLYQYLGYIHWRLKNYEKASEIYERGSKIEGAPPFLKLMAGLMQSNGGNRETARSIYGQMHQGGGDGQIRKTAELRLQWLNSLDERDFLDSALSSFKERNGRCAKNFVETFSLLRSLPRTKGSDLRVNRSNEVVDPTGVPYEIDAETCRAKLGTLSKLPRN
jgi:tetratricopeptide (TPR) repeat protein